jgi:hypothetical protein
VAGDLPLEPSVVRDVLGAELAVSPVMSALERDAA